MWTFKPEVLITLTVWQISLQFRRQTWDFRLGRARRNCQQVTQHRTTIGNSDMATKTGNSCTTGTSTDRVEITTANPGFSTMASPNKVSLIDCDNDRQPEMAMRSPKPEILISLELWQIGWQFQRQIWGFRHAEHEQTGPGRLRQRSTTENDNIDVLGANLAIFGSRSLSQSFG